MYISGIDFPNDIIRAIEEDDLVVFVGAGVSMGAPTSLPSFAKLTEEIALGTGKHCGKNESFESFLGKLKCQNIDVNSIAARALSQMELQHNKLHEYIVELFPDPTKIKIITTNYDNMIEQVVLEQGLKNVKVYDAPALPLGNNIKGIVHIHGNVKEPEYMVLTDEDFGQAYLSDGYVARFLVKLFETYMVLFIGYSYDDTIVRYLTRAMTKYQKKNRFILTDNKDGNWLELGMKPILFEQGRFDVLNDGIHNLGIRIKRGLSDWKNTIKSIADKPSVDLSVESELDYCMQDISKVRLLAEFIEGEEWLWWVEGKGVLENLFMPNVQLNDKESIWLEWLVQKFLGNNDIILKQLILKHNTRLNMVLADRILQKMICHNELFENDMLKEYIVLLDEYILNTWVISRLLDVVMERELYSLGWHLFKKLFEFKLVLKEKIFSSDKDNVYYTHDISGEGYIIENAWEEHGEKFLNDKYLEILSFGMNYIQEIHFKYEQVGMADRSNEPYELLARFSLEKEEKIYDHEVAVSVIGTAIIKACKLGLDNDTIYIRNYIDMCIKSESTMLRLIGIKLLRETVLLTNDEKVELLIENICLYSIWEKEQVFLLISECFDEISSVNQNAILEIIEDGKNYDDEEVSAYAKYNWAVWLQKKCKENERVNKIMEMVKESYPHFRPRENPERDFSFSGATWEMDVSPIDQETMQKMGMSELMKLLKEFKGDRWKGPARDGLLNVFTKCIKKDYSWALMILEEIKKEFLYEADVWDYFFRGIENADFNIEEKMYLIRKLKSDGLIKARSYEISEFIKKFVDQEEIKDLFSIYEDELFEITVDLWNSRCSINRLENCRLIDKCFNSTEGILAMCWIKMLSYQSAIEISQRYKDWFETILGQDEREQMVCVLAGQIAFLFSRDREWVMSVLVPFLKSEKNADFKAAWEGIAWFSRRLYKELADVMIDIYLYAIDRIDELEGEARTGFVDLYTVLMIYVIENPIVEFIPKLYRVANDKDRKQFIKSIDGSLRNMDMMQKRTVVE